MFYGVLQGQQNFLGLGGSMIANRIGKVASAALPVILLSPANVLLKSLGEGKIAVVWAQERHDLAPTVLPRYGADPDRATAGG